MKVIKYISVIAVILCAFILLCACANPDTPPSENRGNSPSNNATDESLPPEATAEDSTPPDTSPEISLPDTQETQPEDTLPEYESGEYPPNFAALLFLQDKYEFQVGQVVSKEFEMGTLTTGIFYDPKDAAFEVVSENPDIVEILSFDPVVMMDYYYYGGITAKCHKPGVSKIYVTITYLPTGGTKTIEATVTVVDPATATE